MSALKRNNVRVSGAGTRPMMFAHGFGCDQNMWRTVSQAFEADFKVVLYDHVGAGGSDLSSYSRAKYDSLNGYAVDTIEIARELDLQDVIFVGHSVSSMIGALADAIAPGLIKALIMLGPSPRYINDGGYVGGFERSQIEELLTFLDTNYLGWSQAMAPTIVGNSDKPELGQELTNSFCRTDPEIAKHFARVTFTADNRADLSRIRARTLVLQCSEDMIAPLVVGKYVHENVANSSFKLMKATGHCPNLSAPQETIEAIRAFV